MNCKPGDLAMVVVGLPENIGKVVEILRAAPAKARFVLPCGHSATTKNTDDVVWVTKSAGSPLVRFFTDGSRCVCTFAAIGDSYLRPLRGLSDEEAEQIRNSRKVSA